MQHLARRGKREEGRGKREEGRGKKIQNSKLRTQNYPTSRLTSLSKSVEWEKITTRRRYDSYRY